MAIASCAVAQDLSASIDRISLNANFDDATLKEVFTTVASLTGFHFTYHANEAYLNDRISVHQQNINVGELLRKISASSGLAFRRRSNNISVRVVNRMRKHPPPIATVRGRVTSQENEEPLPGGNVLVKNSATGTITAIDGTYTLNVANPDTAVLVFSFVGYEPQEIPASGQMSVDVALVPTISNLDEVVVVGYGTQVKRALTGAVASVASETITQNVNADPITSLQGTAAGVHLTQGSGQPGGALRVRVRGSASLLSGGDPLVVVDGIPVITSSFGANSNDGMSGLSEINPNDIESMEVLKDGAAAAIYGSRAANGVVLITTKKGQAGQSSLTLDYQQGVSTPTNRVDLLNGPDLLAVNRRAWENTIFSGTSDKPFFPVPRNVDGVDGYNADVAAVTDVNWLDQVLQNGTFRHANVSASTGSEKTTVFASLGYRDEEGIEIGRDFTRASARVNVNHRGSNRLEASMNVSLSYVKRNDPGDHFGRAQSAALPIFPIYQPDNPTGLFNGFNALDNTIGTNPIFYRDHYANLTQTYRSISQSFIDFRPVPSLSIRSEWGVDYQSNVNDTKLSAQLYPPNNNDSKVGGDGKTYTRRFSTIAWNINHTITYDKTFDPRHGLTVLVGSSLLNQESQGQTFILEGLTFPTLPVASTFERASVSQSLFRFVSFFSRLNYDYDGKYLAQVSARRDGSSRFGPGRRFGNFAGGSLGWIFTEENFLRNHPVVNFGKLRASYGTVGNAELPSDFLWLSLADVNDSEISYGGFNGVTYGRIGNRDLSWETTRQADVGLDLGLLNRRLNVTVDVYHKRSENLLLGSRLANSTGYLERDYVVNVGALRNRGIELSITSDNVRTNHFQWTSSFNLSRNRAVVVALAPPVDAEATQIASFVTGDVKLVEGGHYGTYFLPVWAGVDPTTGNELIYEVDQEYLEATGVARLTGGVLDAEALGGNINRHRMILEDQTAMPDFFGGLSNTLTYRRLTLDLLFYFQYGNYLLDQGEQAQSYPGEQQSLRAELSKEIDVPIGEFSSDVPLVYNSRVRYNSTTRFLHNASFVRLRNVRLSYRLPTPLGAKLGIADWQIYATGQNLLTVTKFPGWDPEAFDGGGNQQRTNAGPGTIGFRLPQARTILLGVTVRF